VEKLLPDTLKSILDHSTLPWKVFYFCAKLSVVVVKVVSNRIDVLCQFTPIFILGMSPLTHIFYYMYYILHDGYVGVVFS
jgi:hypothetical protein